MFQWEKIFLSHILERGYEIYHDKKVDSFELSYDAIEAVVHGEELYDVEIKLSNGDVTKMACSCPYAKYGKRCKHMVAVLYKYESYLKSNEYRKTQMIDKESVEHVLRFVKPQMINEFLIKECSQNKSLLQKLKLIILQSCSSLSFDEQLQLFKILENDYQKIADSYDGDMEEAKALLLENMNVLLHSCTAVYVLSQEYEKLMLLLTQCLNTLEVIQEDFLIVYDEDDEIYAERYCKMVQIYINSLLDKEDGIVFIDWLKNTMLKFQNPMIKRMCAEILDKIH